MLVAGAAVFMFARRGYGEVSEKSYEIATALYSVCNRRDSSKLPDIGALLDSAVAEASISAEEAVMLRDIADQAASGDWKSAIRESRRLMEDQVNYP